MVSGVAESVKGAEWVPNNAAAGSSGPSEEQGSSAVLSLYIL